MKRDLTAIECIKGRPIRRECWPGDISNIEWMDGEFMHEPGGSVSGAVSLAEADDWIVVGAEEPAALTMTGDWQWAGKMGYTGKKVRYSHWATHSYVRVSSSGMWVDERNVITNGPHSQLGDWELYEEPAVTEPAEPELVRWKLKWETNAFVDFLEYQAPDGVWQRIVTLVSTPPHGSRFNAWVYHLPDGRELRVAARFLPIYWSDAGGTWSSDPCQGRRPICPVEVEMVKIKESE